jgi:hypothetical protein
VRVKKPAKKVVFQRHHISYEPEVVVRIRRSVHYLCTQAQRFKAFTDHEKYALMTVIMNKPFLSEPSQYSEEPNEPKDVQTQIK